MTLSDILFLAQTAAPGAGAPGQPSLLSSIVPFVLMGVIFYFLLIRPQQKRQKEHKALITSLKTGDKVITSGGIHGIVSNVKERTFYLKIADNVKIEIDKAAIGTVEARGDSAPSTTPSTSTPAS
ncbi:MAG TPA: preprotein translocase subunit YajC [Chthoniobacterales bacterium]